MMAELSMQVQGIFKKNVFYLILISIISFHQNYSDIFYKDKTKSGKCFSKGNIPIKLYKTAYTVETNKSLPSLEHEEYCWYIIDFSESTDKRFKIKQIKIQPSCHELELPNYKGMWIDKSDYLLINSVYYDFEHGEKLKLYSKPDYNSNIILIDTFYNYNYINFNDKWAQVKYYNNNVMKTAWMCSKDQCCLPWTECPRYEQ